MAHVRGDRILETSTTTGTGAFTLAGAVSGYRAFSAIPGIASSDTVFYCIEHQTANEWEVGIGTWTTGTMTRTTVLRSSNADAAVNFSAGTKNVFNTLPADYNLVRQPDGTFDIPGIAAIPSAPAAGTLTYYARSRAGRMFPEVIGPAGTEWSFQPALFGNNITMWLPGTAATAAINFGVNWTVAATQAHPTITTTNLMSQMKRATFTTSATAGNASGIRSGAVIAWRGNAAGLGGFFFFARGGVTTFLSGGQYMFGLSALTGLLAGEPSAQNNTVAFGKDSGDTNWQLIFRDAAAATKVDLGVAAAVNDVFDVMFFAPPNGSNITARVVNVGTGAVLANNTVHTTNIPQNTALLAAHAVARNGATASATAIGLNRIYVESDT